MYKRFVEQRAEEAVSDTPAVLIVGPRRAGKTTLVHKIGEVGQQQPTNGGSALPMAMVAGRRHGRDFASEQEALVAAARNSRFLRLVERAIAKLAA